MIIGLGYKARSGKDTAADYLCKEYDYSRAAFSFELKAFLYYFLGIVEEHLIHGDKSQKYPFWNNMSVREILQKVGTDALRNNFDKDIWVKLALNTVSDGIFQPIYNPTDKIVFTDLRFENEAKGIKDAGGILIRIDRHNVGLSGSEAMHESETELDSFSGWDYILDNNESLENFYEGIDTIMSELNIEKEKQPEILTQLPKGFA